MKKEITLSKEEKLRLNKSCEHLRTQAIGSTQFMRLLNNDLYIVTKGREYIEDCSNFYNGANDDMQKLLNNLGYQYTVFGISLFEA